MIEINKELGYDTYVLDLDIAKAYDSVDRNYVRELMDEYGVDVGILSIWELLNDKPMTDLYFNNELIGSYEQQKGLRQGASSSPIIYNLIPDKWARDTEHIIENWLYGDQFINSWLYADDNKLMTRSLEDL